MLLFILVYSLVSLLHSVHRQHIQLQWPVSPSNFFGFVAETRISHQHWRRKLGFMALRKSNGYSGTQLARVQEIRDSCVRILKETCFTTTSWIKLHLDEEWRTLCLHQ